MYIRRKYSIAIYVGNQKFRGSFKYNLNHSPLATTPSISIFLALRNVKYAVFMSFCWCSICVNIYAQVVYHTEQSCFNVLQIYE